MRLFIAVVPSEEAVADLEEFVAPRQAPGDGIRWTLPYQWHVTLAFCPDVAEHRLDDLTERVARAAARRRPVPAAVAGGGAFPNAAAAKVLYAGLVTGPSGAPAAQDTEELRRLAVGARTAAQRAGVAVSGTRFRPHLTLGRLGRPVDVTKWLRVLDAYHGPPWEIAEVAVIESLLGQGPRGKPRYEVVAAFPLG